MRAVRVAAAVAVAVVAVGCAGRGGDSGTPPSVRLAEPADRLSVTAREFGFDPDSWIIAAGRSVDIEFNNRGTIPHEWALLRAGARPSSQREFSDDMVLFEVEAIAEGSAATAAFSVKEPGTYLVICALQGHLDAGMRGTLTVR